MAQEEHEPGDAPPETGDWLDRMGAGGVAAVGVAFALLSLAATAALNQIGAARSGMASDFPGAAEAAFEAPEVSIATRIVPRDAPRWIANAAPFARPDGRSLVAVVLLDDGGDPGAVLDMLSRPEPLALAVAHDFVEGRDRAAIARRRGHEVLVALPMGYGEDFARFPNVLASHLSAREAARRTAWHLAAIEDHVGVVDLAAEDIVRNPGALRPVIEVLEASGGLVIDSRSDTRSLFGAMARAEGIPTGIRTVRVDAGDDDAGARAKFEDAAAHARRWGHALMLVEGRRAALAHLAEWLDGAAADLRIAPVTSVVAMTRTEAGG